MTSIAVHLLPELPANVPLVIVHDHERDDIMILIRPAPPSEAISLAVQRVHAELRAQVVSALARHDIRVARDARRAADARAQLAHPFDEDES